MAFGWWPMPRSPRRSRRGHSKKAGRLLIAPHPRRPNAAATQGNWHGHSCRRGRRPTSNVEFWNRKLDRNVSRDAENQAALQTLGWRPIIIWECEIKDAGILNRIQEIAS